MIDSDLSICMVLLPTYCSLAVLLLSQQLINVVHFGLLPELVVPEFTRLRLDVEHVVLRVFTIASGHDVLHQGGALGVWSTLV